MATNNATNNDTVNGDSGSASGRPITFNGLTNAGKTMKFTGSGSTISLSTSDANGNIYMGAGAGNTTTSGTFNTVVGFGGGPAITSGANNTGLGGNVLNACTSGANNAGMGSSCLFKNTTGFQNLAIGTGALQQITTGSNNVCLGYLAGFSYTGAETNNIQIGGSVIGTAGESNVIRIGTQGSHTTCIIAAINGATVTGSAVLASTTGQLGTIVSSLKYKDNIEDMGDTSSALMECRPVTFTYKTDETKHLHYGLIAEEVEKVLPALVLKDSSGNPQSIAYHEMPVMLLNEIIKLRARIEELERTKS